MESAVFMGKNYLNNCQSIVNTTDLTLKQMFDISTRLVSEQDEISGLETIGWENHSRKYLSSIGDERVINLQRTKVCPQILVPVRPQRRHRRTRQVHLQVQQQSEVTIRHQETGAIHQKLKTKRKREITIKPRKTDCGISQSG